MEKMFPMRSLRSKAHYADKAVMAGEPVAVVKVGKRTDYVTAVEFIEALYGRKVEKIVFAS